MKGILVDIAGWKIETIGNDVARMGFGRNRRLYAINCEVDFLGISPGTGEATNRNAVETLTANAIDEDVWRTEARPNAEDLGTLGERVPSALWDAQLELNRIAA